MFGQNYFPPEIVLILWHFHHNVLDENHGQKSMSSTFFCIPTLEAMHRNLCSVKLVLSVSTLDDYDPQEMFHWIAPRE